MIGDSDYAAPDMIICPHFDLVLLYFRSEFCCGLIIAKRLVILLWFGIFFADYRLPVIYGTVSVYMIDYGSRS